MIPQLRNWGDLTYDIETDKIKTTLIMRDYQVFEVTWSS